MSSSQQPASNVPEEDEFTKAMRQVQAEAAAKLAAIAEKKKAADEARKRAEEERIAREEAERKKAEAEKAEKERRDKEAAEAAEMEVDEDEDEDELADVVQCREERARMMRNTALPKRRRLKEVDAERKKLEESIYRGVQRFPERPANDPHRYSCFADGFNYASGTRWEMDEVHPCSKCARNGTTCWRRVIGLRKHNSCLRCFDKKRPCFEEPVTRIPNKRQRAQVDSDSEEEVGLSRRARVESGSSESQALLAMTRETMAFMRESTAAFGDLAREMRGAVCEIHSAVNRLGRDLHNVLQDHADAQLRNAVAQEAMTKVMESISSEMWINWKRAELWKKREREARAAAAQQAAEKSGEDVEMGAEGAENEDRTVEKRSEGAESGDKEVEKEQEDTGEVEKEVENDVREDGEVREGGEVEESQTLQD